MAELTTEEKIDYIYKTLKKQESRIFWSNLIKWIIRITIILYLIYAYYYILPWFIENIKNILSPKFSVESLDFDSVKNLFNK